MVTKTIGKNKTTYSLSDGRVLVVYPDGRMDYGTRTLLNDLSVFTPEFAAKIKSEFGLI